MHIDEHIESTQSTVPDSSPGANFHLYSNMGRFDVLSVRQRTYIVLNTGVTVASFCALGTMEFFIDKLTKCMREGI